ncbi:unnamed protein product [Paramecium primaurelia]|uniref:Uncharacterized protein n=1 Tax=Paramecium primaurelia TaxID=5886 RepID=A0A8S1PXV6_PARPR|nr:unnamed protein product [Paramecium primaurelia]
MNKAISCKKHPKFFIQWITILKEGVNFGCIKCLDQINNRRDIIYLPEIIENPSIVIPHLPINEQYISFYENLDKFSQEQLEKYYGDLETTLHFLCELLKNLIQNGRANLEEFKKKCKEHKEQLYQQFKIQEISELIQEFEQQQNQDAQDQIEKKLIDLKEKMNQDLMKEQSSIIKKIYNETSLAIDKFNLNCNQQIKDFSNQINRNIFSLKEFFKKSFVTQNTQKQIFSFFNSSQYARSNEIQLQNQSHTSLIEVDRSNCLFFTNNFPYYFSKIVPQYYLDHIIKQANYYMGKFLSYNNEIQLKAYSIFEPNSQEIVNKKHFWKLNPQLKSNAQLLIFKSNNDGNHIFGYFKISLVEFIFSYTHNEIYPKKQMIQNPFQNGGFFKNLQSKAQNEIDSFIVGDSDLQIHSNLIDGKSMLGQEFLWDSQKNDIKQTEYLFGGEKPNIQICEVFDF